MWMMLYDDVMALRLTVLYAVIVDVCSNEED
jgi:hypothetical protein